MKQGFTVWLTGMSGAGKSSISERLAAELSRRGENVEVLDGDEVRTHLSKGLGFSKEDRDINIDRIAFVAKLLVKHGAAVITAAISPYEEAREKARNQIGNCLQVYVRCSIEELARRDVKGLYAKAMRGEIGQFTGISDEYEEPKSPDVIVDTEHEEIAESVGKIIAGLEAKGYLRAGEQARA